MQEKHQDKTPPRHRKVDAEPGQPDYQPGVTGTPDQPVYDEDAEAEKTIGKTKTGNTHTGRRRHQNSQ